MIYSTASAQTIGSTLEEYQNSFPDGILEREDGQLYFNYFDTDNSLHICTIDKKIKVCMVEFVIPVDKKCLEEWSASLDENWSVIDTENWEIVVDESVAYHASLMPMEEDPKKLLMFYFDVKNTEDNTAKESKKK
jgi:hypothetical protein